MGKVVEGIKQLVPANEDVAVVWFYGLRARGIFRDGRDIICLSCSKTSH